MLYFIFGILIIASIWGAVFTVIQEFAALEARVKLLETQRDKIEKILSRSLAEADI